MELPIDIGGPIILSYNPYVQTYKVQPAIGMRRGTSKTGWTLKDNSTKLSLVPSWPATGGKKCPVVFKSVTKIYTITSTKKYTYVRWLECLFTKLIFKYWKVYTLKICVSNCWVVITKMRTNCWAAWSNMNAWMRSVRVAFVIQWTRKKQVRPDQLL